MSNIIRLDSSSPVDTWLEMQNGLTDVLINTILLSGSFLAKTIDEKRLIVWLAEKDQTLGSGTVGFDVCNMPWNPDTFYENKAFMLKVVQEAENKLGWEKLDYEPNVELLIPCLKKFSFFIYNIDINSININILKDWLASADEKDPINCNFPCCEKHHTLLTFLGCQLCNR